MIYAAADELLGGGDTDVDGGGTDVDGGGGDTGVDGGGVGVCVCVGVDAGVGVGAGELLGCGVGVGDGADAVGLFCTGDVAGVLFAGSCAARLLASLLLVGDGAGPLVVEPAPDPSVFRGFALVRPAEGPGAGALPALAMVPGDAAE
jgi:hypothetical protein